MLNVWESCALGVVEIDEALTCLIKERIELSVVFEFFDDFEMLEIPSWEEVSINQFEILYC
jgi:hypothetical protein